MKLKYCIKAGYTFHPCEELPTKPDPEAASFADEQTANESPWLMIWVESSWLWHRSWFKMWLALARCSKNPHYLDAMYSKMDSLPSWKWLWEATPVIFKIKISNRKFLFNGIWGFAPQSDISTLFSLSMTLDSTPQTWHNYVKKKT